MISTSIAKEANMDVESLGHLGKGVVFKDCQQPVKLQFGFCFNIGRKAVERTFISKLMQTARFPIDPS